MNLGGRPHVRRWAAARSRGRAVPVLLIALAVAGGAAAAAPNTTLVVTELGGPAVIDAPIVAGIATGIFHKHGLDVRLVPVASGFEALEKVADGSAHVGNAAGTALAQTVGQGAHLKAIVVSNGDATGSVPTDSYVGVVARAASGVRAGHLEDLAGKRIGVRRRSDFHQYAFSALAAKGLDPLTAVTVVDTGDLLGALQNGTADAVVGSEPGTSRVLRSVAGALLVQRGGNVMQFLEVRAVSSRYLATHPGTLTRYVTAFVEAAQFVRAHPDETTDMLMAHRRVAGISRDLVRAAIGFLNADVRVSKATVRAVHDGAEFALRIGAVREAPAFDEMFDLRILRQVERKHPELFTDLPPIPDSLKL